MSYRGKKTALANGIFPKDIAGKANFFFLEGWGALGMGKDGRQPSLKAILMGNRISASELVATKVFECIIVEIAFL